LYVADGTFLFSVLLLLFSEFFFGNFSVAKLKKQKQNLAMKNGGDF
jgi:hypothetical protein